jgi:hypothetical protein
VRGKPDIGQQFLELIRRLGWLATEDVLAIGEGIDVAMLTRPFRRPDTNRRPRCALRSDDTDAFSRVGTVPSRQAPGVARPPAQAAYPLWTFMTEHNAHYQTERRVSIMRSLVQQVATVVPGD